MSEFDKAFGSLNKAQLEAVKQIDGPVLVIAGPGTGKTQLISTRVGYILQETDVLARNILLLTFTEAGVDSLRQRLTKFLGQTAYEVNISTYHAFGSEIIRRNPEYFEAGLEPIDELESFTILRRIISRLPYANPIKYAEAQLADILGFISDAKRALLSPRDIRTIAESNRRQITALNKETGPILKSLDIVSQKNLPVFQKLAKILEKQAAIETKLPDDVSSLAKHASEGLEAALAEAVASGKTTAVTLWKNVWLAKDRGGQFIFTGEAQNQKINAAADVYKKYQDTLKRRRLYDYDDMIIRAIEGLEQNPELKYSLAEQYQYIMLDEFQDTNPAQWRLIELMSDHPVLEGRPNVLAVGDDDQAIYTFQGANHANMAQFARHYKQVKIVNLTENYRSQPEIIETAKNVAAQINERLQDRFPEINKQLIPASEKASAKRLEVREFKSDAAQHEWLAAEIEQLNSREDIPLSEIAILAPRHRNLMTLLPYLSQKKLPIRYERRDNILEMPLVRQLEQMSRLTLALADNQLEQADALWPEILSYDFWSLSTEDIWGISWQAKDSQQSWSQTLLKNPKTKKIMLFFLRLKDLMATTTLEQQLDILVGLPEISTEQNMPLTSPLFEHYFGRKVRDNDAAFVELLGQLSALRRRILERRRVEGRPLNLANFIDFIEESRAAGLNVLDTNAYSEAEEAINIMTAHAAKGREFRAVFLIDAHDEVWGSASRTRGQYLSLPANLQFIRYRGASEDERLRLLYVALTRAKTHLYLSSYSRTLAGKSTNRLKYLDIREDENGQLRSQVLPKPSSSIILDDKDSLSLKAAQNYWSARHYSPFKPTLNKLLADHLKRYQLSATHVNQFTDVTTGGAQAYLLNCLLHFPHARAPAAQYGTAIHQTIRWLLRTAVKDSKLPSLNKTLAHYEDRLKRQRLSPLDHELFLERGRLSLTAWLAQMSSGFNLKDQFELSFRNEAAFIGDVHLTGVVDRLSVDKPNRLVTITDFKTGQPYQRWVNSNIRLHKYRQQLLIYKILIERSRAYRGYTVDKAFLEFVEPDEYGQIVHLELPYDPREVEAMQKLLSSIWRHIHALDFPSPDDYAPTIAGIRNFEQKLIEGAT